MSQFDGLVPEIAKRRARRAIDTRPIPVEVVDRLKSAATLAASCANNQPWRYVFVQEKDTLDAVKVHLSGGNYWAKTAPLIVLVATRLDLDASLSNGRDYAFFDTGMAVASLMLQATKEGLYAHPIAGFDPPGAKQVAGVPEDYTLLTLVIVGYPGDESDLNEKHAAAERAERERKPIDEVTADDGWSFQ